MGTIAQAAAVTLALALLTGGPLAVSAQDLVSTVTTTLQNAQVNSLVWAGDTLNLTVTGGSVPADATAVVLNVTVTDTNLAPSYLTVYPAGGALPLASNLNWVPRQTVPNLIVVPVGTNGQISITDYAGSTDVVVDLEGYFAPPSGGSTAGEYIPLVPTRIADTRPGSGQAGAGHSLGPQASLTVQVAGAGDVPATNVAAAVLEVTATDTTASSYLTAYPAGAPRPTASNLNWAAGATVANTVVVPVSSSGQITLFNASGTADVVVDVSGYFSAATGTPANASLYTPLAPVRVLDTRAGAGAPLPPGGSLTQPLAGLDGISSTATAVTANITTTDTTAASYLTVYPGGARPLVSALNWAAGQTIANLAVATLSSSGGLSLYNAFGQADVVMDVSGWFGPAAAGVGDVYSPLAPTRILDTRSTPILQAHPGSYLAINQGGGYPGAAAIQADLAFPNNAYLISSCSSQWQAGTPCGVDGFPGQCAYWVELNWDGLGEGGPSATGPGATGLVGNGDDVAKSAIQRGFASVGSMATIAVGDLVSWAPGEGQYDPLYGHAAIVVEVDPGNGTYIVSEMNYLNANWELDYRVVGMGNPDVPTIAVPIAPAAP
ncbi:MAG: CHAP domain-containing protein [Candidatus Dormibacteria bacterium]